MSYLQPEVSRVQLLSMVSVKWHLGHVVRALRDEKGWTQEQLASRTKRPQDKKKLNKATINSIEQLDRNHGRETLERVAFALGSSLGELYALVPQVVTSPDTSSTEDVIQAHHFNEPTGGPPNAEEREHPANRLQEARDREELDARYRAERARKTEHRAPTAGRTTPTASVHRSKRHASAERVRPRSAGKGTRR